MVRVRIRSTVRGMVRGTVRGSTVRGIWFLYRSISSEIYYLYAILTDIVEAKSPKSPRATYHTPATPILLTIR